MKTALDGVFFGGHLVLKSYGLLMGSMFGFASGLRLVREGLDAATLGFGLAGFLSFVCWALLRKK